jgi:hypothetical protein
MKNRRLRYSEAAIFFACPTDTCGSEPARDGDLKFNIPNDWHAAIASTFAPTWIYAVISTITQSKRHQADQVTITTTSLKAPRIKAQHIGLLFGT